MPDGNYAVSGLSTLGGSATSSNTPNLMLTINANSAFATTSFTVQTYINAAFNDCYVICLTVNR